MATVRRKTKEERRREAESIPIQISSRIPYSLNERLNEYVLFMRQPENVRPRSTHHWPTTKQEAIEEAINDFLALHTFGDRKERKTTAQIKQDHPASKPPTQRRKTSLAASEEVQSTQPQTPLSNRHKRRRKP